MYWLENMQQKMLSTPVGYVTTLVASYLVTVIVYWLAWAVLFGGVVIR